jgi:hypothetical protein
MRTLIGAVLLVSGAAVPDGPTARSWLPPPCLAPDPVSAAQRIDYLATLVSSTATDRARVREAVGLPNLLHARVTLVADSTICAAAVLALARHRQESPVHTGLIVYDLEAVGFAVENPELVVPAGEYRPRWLFDQAWAYLGTLAGI